MLPQDLHLRCGGLVVRLRLFEHVGNVEIRKLPGARIALVPLVAGIAAKVKELIFVVL